MGIHPETSTKTVPATREHPELLVKITTTPGLSVKKTYELVSTEETRDDCFCCTCDVELPNGEFLHLLSDPYCRNHGHDHGRRPCDVHNMPGIQYEGDLDEILPVTAYREAVKNGTLNPR